MSNFAVAAQVKVCRPADMSDRGRREIAEWLHKVAEDLVRCGHDYAPNFTSCYTYEPAGL